MSLAARGAREDEGVVMSWAACGMREASSAAARGPADEDDTSGAACGTTAGTGAALGVAGDTGAALGAAGITGSGAGAPGKPAGKGQTCKGG